MLRRARRGVSGYAACSGSARGAQLVRAARDGPVLADAHGHSSEMALRVFACARGRTRSFHAVCLEKGMRGAGRACVVVWEFGVCPEGGVV